MAELTQKGFFLEDSALIKSMSVDDLTALDSSGEVSFKSSSKLIAKSSFFTQLYWLTFRELLNTQRDIASLAGRFGVTIFLSLLLGLIFMGAGSNDDSNPDNFSTHFGAITFTTIMSMFGAAQPVMLTFPFERPMFMRG